MAWCFVDVAQDPMLPTWVYLDKSEPIQQLAIVEIALDLCITSRKDPVFQLAEGGSHWRTSHLDSWWSPWRWGLLHWDHLRWTCCLAGWARTLNSNPLDPLINLRWDLLHFRLLVI
jgi:hypothetical protein